METMNKTWSFLRELDELWAGTIPEEVMLRARRSLQDYLAVTCAGAAFQREKLGGYFAFAGQESGRYRAIGTGRDLPLKEAVFLNGLNGHALDFDDGTNAGIIHLGSPIFSLLLPLAQKFDLSTEKVLRAAIIGYECSYTLAVSMQPGHKALGFHATGTCGVLGATYAASLLLGLSEEERRQAFAAACVSGSGMLLVLDDGSELKPYNVAKSALLALTSLELAKAGFRGHPDPLGAERGYLKMMTGKRETPLQPVMLNGSYAIMKSYTKPYASCRYTHPAVEAAIHLRDREGIRSDDVEQIEVRTYSLAVSGHDHTEIPGCYSAKMSIPYSVAVGLRFGRAGLKEFSENAVRDAATLALTKKIRVAADEEISRAFPRIQAAELRIFTRDACWSERVDFPKGEPENPLSDEEFRERYNGLMTYAGIDPARSDAVFEALDDGNTPINPVVTLL